MSIHTTDLDSWRDKIIVDIGGQKSLARWSWTELSRLELFPGSELGGGRITVPESWLPSGPQRRLSARSVDLFVVGDVELSIKARRCEWLGRAGAALWLPYTSMNGAKVASPWTWLSRARLINRMRDHAVKLMSDDEWDLWPYLAELAKDGHRILTENERTKQDFDHIIRILSDSSRDGLMIPLASTPAGGEQAGQSENDVMLGLHAVLVFVDEEARIAGSDDIVDMTSGQERQSVGPERRIVASRRLELEEDGIMSAAQGEGGNQLQSPSVYGRQTIVPRWDGKAVEPLFKCGDACIGMRKDQNWLPAVVPSERGRNQMCFAASGGSADASALDLQEVRDVLHWVAHVTIDFTTVLNGSPKSLN